MVVDPRKMPPLQSMTRLNAGQLTAVYEIARLSPALDLVDRSESSRRALMAWNSHKTGLISASHQHASFHEETRSTPP